MRWRIVSVDTFAECEFHFNVDGEVHFQNDLKIFLLEPVEKIAQLNNLSNADRERDIEDAIGAGDPVHGVVCDQRVDDGKDLRLIDVVQLQKNLVVRVPQFSGVNQGQERGDDTPLDKGVEPIARGFRWHAEHSSEIGE